MNKVKIIVMENADSKTRQSFAEIYKACLLSEKGGVVISPVDVKIYDCDAETIQEINPVVAKLIKKGDIIIV